MKWNKEDTMDGGPYRAVPQRLFANWEMDRASTSAVQRIFTLSVSRLSLFPCPAQMRSFVITAKLEGYKRSLRSNEIVISEDTGSIDIPLDISFTIQYPHFLKHKRNLMQIHIQRKRKYKNRPIPGGFKSVAVGAIDLTSILQCGSSSRSEIAMYSYEATKRSTNTDISHNTIGRLVISSCSTLPVDTDADGRIPATVKDKVVELSDESEISDEEDSDLPDGNGVLTSGRSEGGQRPNSVNANVRHGTSSGLRDSQRRRKRAQQKKNMKQRVMNILKKFRVPDEGGIENTVASSGRELTAKEMQELFDELDELSDSGNEAIAPDEMSIVSNPRPALRPYFSSREQLPLPPISDDRPSESEGEDVEWSSEADGGTGKLEPPADPTTTSGVLTTWGSPWKGSSMPHSQTSASIVGREKDKVARNASLSDQLYSILATDGSTVAHSGRPMSSVSAECIWLCQVQDENLLSSLAAAHASIQDHHQRSGGGQSSITPLHLVPTNTQKDVRTAIQQIVGKIQMFCNSNSTSPPLTWVGVLGPDRLVSQVLRAYVDVLQHKSSSSWLQYLRFVLIVPPNSHIGRLVFSHDCALEQLSRDIWERWSDLSPSEQSIVAERMGAWPLAASKAANGQSGNVHSSSFVNLVIGEALLQLTNKEKDKDPSDSSDRLFVPFLSEVRLCCEGGSEEGGAGPSGGQQCSSTSTNTTTISSYPPPSSSITSSHSPRGITSTTPYPSTTTDHSYSSPAPPPSGGVSTVSSFYYNDGYQPSSSAGQSSPPASPHTKGGSSSSDRQEVQVEYWVSNVKDNDVMLPIMTGQLPTTPQGKKGDSTKESMKSHFKTLMINRPNNTALLKLQFIKEKKKDKMFQKLGMNKKSKCDLDVSPSTIFNVSRLLCSAQGKHTLTILVDGCAYPDVRFFATSSQWQTHVKHFPVGLLSPALAAIQ